MCILPPFLKTRLLSPIVKSRQRICCHCFSVQEIVFFSHHPWSLNFSVSNSDGGNYIMRTLMICTARPIFCEAVAYRVGWFGGFKPPAKFRRYWWSPRSHKQEEPASRFPFAVHFVLIRFNLENKGVFNTNCLAVAYLVSEFKPTPTSRKFDKVEPDCKLSGKC